MPTPDFADHGKLVAMVLTALSGIGGVFLGMKRVRGEVREMVREDAAPLISEAIDKHNRDDEAHLAASEERHSVILAPLYEIRDAVTRVETRLEERWRSLDQRVAALESLMRDKLIILARSRSDDEPGSNHTSERGHEK